MDALAFVWVQRLESATGSSYVFNVTDFNEESVWDVNSRNNFCVNKKKRAVME